ncbi:MAG: hypothetical protein LBQ98_02610, partial [Nitrososphaerota archaeon]|nr:hypothetical protein [Nitrososphaerota archaeon]
GRPPQLNKNNCQPHPHKHHKGPHHPSCLIEKICNPLTTSTSQNPLLFYDLSPALFYNKTPLPNKTTTPTQNKSNKAT